MEIEHILVIAAVLITTVFIFLCFTAPKAKDGAQPNQTTDIPHRKQHFSLPLSKADVQQQSENMSVINRLGLSRDDGCVITISIDIQVRNLIKKLSFLSNFSIPVDGKY